MIVKNNILMGTTTPVRKRLVTEDDAIRLRGHGFKFAVIDRYDRAIGKRETDIIRDFFRDNRMRMRKRLSSWGALVIFFKSEADLNYFLLMNQHFERVTWEW